MSIPTDPDRIAPPPRTEAWLRRRLALTPAGRFVVGDLREEYAEMCARRSRLVAVPWYWVQAVRLGVSRRARVLRRPIPPDARSRSGLGWFETIASILQDLRYGLRALAKIPGFAIAAVLTLALVISAIVQIRCIPELIY